MQARIDGTALSEDTIEAGVRAVAPMSAATAATLLNKMLLREVPDRPAYVPSVDTLRAVLSGLAREQNVEAHKQLAAAVEALFSAGEPDATRPLNVVLRSLARLNVQGAIRKAETLAAAGLEIEPSTYEQFATCCLGQGEQALASEMLEARDYL